MQPRTLFQQSLNPCRLLAISQPSCRWCENPFFTGCPAWPSPGQRPGGTFLPHLYHRQRVRCASSVRESKGLRSSKWAEKMEEHERHPSQRCNLVTALPPRCRAEHCRGEALSIAGHPDPYFMNKRNSNSKETTAAPALHMQHEHDETQLGVTCCPI